MSPCSDRPYSVLRKPATACCNVLASNRGVVGLGDADTVECACRLLSVDDLQLDDKSDEVDCKGGGGGGAGGASIPQRTCREQIGRAHV